MPNAMYGSWEDALVEYNWNLGDAEVLRRKYDALISK
jgi:predicted secreted acid phosphatase